MVVLVVVQSQAENIQDAEDMEAWANSAEKETEDGEVQFPGEEWEVEGYWFLRGIGDGVLRPSSYPVVLLFSV